MTTDLSEQSPAQRIATLVSESQASLSGFHDAMDEERAFCWDLEQYEQDTGNIRDRNRVQPRDQSVFRLARFTASEMMRIPLYFRAKARDQRDDPRRAKWARWALQMDVEDPTKRFDFVCNQVIWAGLTSRTGIMRVDWDPSIGIWGDAVFSHVDAKDAGWTPGYVDPHHARCPWMFDVDRMLPETIRRMVGWKNTDDVQPDNGLPGATGSMSNTDQSGRTYFDTGVKPTEQPMPSQQFTTVVKFWERFGGKVRKPKGYRVLTEQERYMAIAAGEHVGQRVHMDYHGEPMPEVDINDDGVPLKRIDAVLEEEESYAYPNGKLTICAPWSGEGIVFYEGPWPQPMRTFPYLVWRPYVNPWRQHGTSDVDLNWTMTLVKNATVRRWYEQLRESRGIMLIPGKGLKDQNDEEFRYTDANGFVAIYDTQMPATQVRYVEGPQPSPQLQAFVMWAENDLRAQEGSSDIATMGSAESLKGVPVGVMQQAVQSGNTSINDKIRTWQAELGLFLCVLHDIQRARWTVGRWMRYVNEEGLEAWASMRGADIPQADISISTKPGLDATDAAQLDNIMKLSQLAMANPRAAEVAARHVDIDPEDMAAILEGLAPPPMPPGAPGMPPGAPPGPPPGGRLGAPSSMGVPRGLTGLPAAPPQRAPAMVPA